MRSFTYDSYKISDSDGIFCIFDARNKDHAKQIWIDDLREIIKDTEKNKVISVGIRSNDETSFSQIIEEFNLGEEAEERLVSLLFFKIGENFRLDIYDHLGTLLDTIKNLLFSY
ncbi:MAG: hypothetical protein EU542_09390 [Promethearchaeota archaeon]|nr:MAG: hypothetical protein EU542_09390 [Candidatus Lokiarchaeota archaeon]